MDCFRCLNIKHYCLMFMCETYLEMFLKLALLHIWGTGLKIMQGKNIKFSVEISFRV